MEFFKLTAPATKGRSRLGEKVLRPDVSYVGGKPCITVTIGEHEVECLVDTGSQVTTVTNQWFQTHIDQSLLLNSQFIKLTGANGLEIPYVGHFTTEIQIEGQHLHDVGIYVLKSATATPCILGTNVLERLPDLCAIVRFKPVRTNTGSGILHPLKDDNTNRPASAALLAGKQKIRLPSRAVRAVPVKFKHSYDGRQVLFEPNRDLEVRGLIVCHTFTKVQGDVAHVHVINLSDEDTTLSPTHVLGYMHTASLHSTHTEWVSCNELRISAIENVSHGSDHAPSSQWECPVDLSSFQGSEDEKKTLEKLLYKYDSLFSRSETDLGYTEKVRHRIVVTDETPIKQPYRRLPPSHFKEVQDHVKGLVDAGIAKESSSPWASPIVVVRKKDGSLRMCVDYRSLNSKTKKDAYPLPRVADYLDALGGATLFSSLDLTSGYYQVAMSPEDVEKTAFTTPFGLYEFLRLPMGLSNSASTFQRLMQGTMHDMLFQTLLVYLDDILVFSKTFQDHILRLERLFSRLSDIGVKLKGSKCHLCLPSVEFLGHHISADGIQTMPDKVTAIQNAALPKTQKDLRAFLGLASYYRRFVKNFAKIAKPLHDLVGALNSTTNHVAGSKGKKPVPIGEHWSQDCDEAFSSLKKALTSTPLLGFPDFDLPFILETDASYEGLGAVLYQIQGEQRKVIAYASRTLRAGERSAANNSSRRLEFLAIKWAVTEKFRSYLLGSHVDILTDNQSLIYWEKAKLGAIEQRWMAALSCFDYTVKFRSGASNRAADFLSRYPVLGGESEIDSDDEGGVNICSIKLDSDSSSTKLPPTLVQAAGSDSPQPPTANVCATNVLPGYSNVDLAALQAADPEIKSFIQLHDSDTRTSRSGFRKLLPGTRTLLNQGAKIKKIDNLFRRRCKPPGENEVWQLIIPASLTQKVLESVHDNGHQGRDRIMNLLKSRCYWPRMAKDVKKFLADCQACSRAKPGGCKLRAPAGSILATRPLEVVSMDFTLLEKDKQGYENVLVITDAFTKFTIAVPTRNQTAYTVARVLVDRWFSCFGIPERLHSDQGRNFESDIVAELCRFFGVKKTRTTPYNPPGNGIVERFNNTLHSLLRTLPPHQVAHWSQHLSAVVTIYNSTPHASTGYSPHYLMFGNAPRLPIDSLLNASGEDVKNGDWLSVHKCRLREAHERSAVLLKERARARKDYLDKQPKARALQVGECVRKRLHFKVRSKIQPLWSSEIFEVLEAPGVTGGPYVLSRTDGSGELSRATGTQLKRCNPVNESTKVTPGQFLPAKVPLAEAAPAITSELTSSGHAVSDLTPGVYTFDDSHDVMEPYATAPILRRSQRLRGRVADLNACGVEVEQSSQWETLFLPLLFVFAVHVFGEYFQRHFSF